MKLSDENYEKLLRVFTPFVLSELEEVTSFEDKTDKEREEVIRACMKSLEISTVIFSKLLKEEGLNLEKLNKAFDLVKEQKLSELSEFFSND